MTNLLQFAIHVRKSHRQHQRSLQLLSEDFILFFWVELHASLWDSNIQNASKKFVSCTQFSFVNFVLHPKPPKYLTNIACQIKNLYPGNHSALDTLCFEHSFLKIIYSITSQNINLSSWITLYIFAEDLWPNHFMMPVMHTPVQDERHRSKIGRFLCVMDHGLIQHAEYISSRFDFPIKQWEFRKMENASENILYTKTLQVVMLPINFHR